MSAWIKGCTHQFFFNLLPLYLFFLCKLDFLQIFPAKPREKFNTNS